jgi:hypothetical protein
MFNPYPENSKQQRLFEEISSKAQDLPPLEVMQVVDDICNDKNTLPPDSILYEQYKLF